MQEPRPVAADSDLFQCGEREAAFKIGDAARVKDVEAVVADSQPGAVVVVRRGGQEHHLDAPAISRARA